VALPQEGELERSQPVIALLVLRREALESTSASLASLALTCKKLLIKIQILAIF
jgi:hypothetical protein